MNDRVFYVYEHWRADKDQCFYVGKGRGRRANIVVRKNNYHTNIHQKLEDLGMCVEVRMVESGLGEAEALALEMTRIAFWRSRGIVLANMTDGGEGTSGRVHPVNIGNTYALGRKQSQTAKDKISAARKGVPNKYKGLPRPANVQTRIAEANRSKAKKHSPESLAKISAARKLRTGFTLSEITKAKLRIKAIAREAAKRAAKELTNA